MRNTLRCHCCSVGYGGNGLFSLSFSSGKTYYPTKISHLAPFKLSNARCNCWILKSKLGRLSHMAPDLKTSFNSSVIGLSKGHLLQVR